MIGVGIHEGVCLSTETKINEEKGNLELHFKIPGKEGDDMWASLEKGEEVSEETVRIIIWNLNMTTWEGDVKAVGQLVKELQAFESQLKAILKVYLTSDKIAEYLGGTKMFENTGITKTNFAAKLADEDQVLKVQKNIATIFLKACTENDIFNNEQAFRLKLARQNATKHYPKLPGGFGKWIESMVIPKDKSELVWSKYEVDNKLTTGEPAVADSVGAGEEVKAKSLFNNLEENEDEVEINIEE